MIPVCEEIAENQNQETLERCCNESDGSEVKAFLEVWKKKKQNDEDYPSGTSRGKDHSLCVCEAHTTTAGLLDPSVCRTTCVVEAAFESISFIL